MYNNLKALTFSSLTSRRLLAKNPNFISNSRHFGNSQYLMKNWQEKIQPIDSKRPFGYLMSTAAKVMNLNGSEEDGPSISSIMPSSRHSLKIVFDNNKSAEYKYIWLRDNCKCSDCIHPETQQKLLDTPSIDVNECKPRSVGINENGQMVILWENESNNHLSTYDPTWMYDYGQSFMKDTFDHMGETQRHRPEIVLWDRTKIWNQFPEISYEEFSSSEEGLLSWLEMFHIFGLAVIRKVPTQKNKIIELVSRFGYVKETSYGITFDVVNEPIVKGAHLANTGKHLHHHTDLNYREKTPGMQILHCLEYNSNVDFNGGLSFFVDGFRIAKWLEENEPTAFHLLTTTPIRFQINHKGKEYCQTWPIICTDNQGNLNEIHYNNRTMGTLIAPNHIVLPFYHAYRIFTLKMREKSSELRFQLNSGDVVAFNNRRILHGREKFDATKVKRYLQGCYIDLDEYLSKYDELLRKNS